MTARKPPAQATPAKKSATKKAPAKAPASKAPTKRAPAARKGSSEVDTFEAAYEAHRLRVSGMPWRDVARLAGYATETSAQLAVQAYLQRAVLERSKEQRAAALATELDRLDELHYAYYRQALGGDLDAAKFVLSVSAQRAKYEGLEVRDDAPETRRTIVITGSSEEYIGRLKDLVLAPPEHRVIEGS